MNQISIKDAYNKGWRSKAYNPAQAQELFVRRYCNHSYLGGMCDLCRAWWNGFDDQGEHISRHTHALRCPLGLADPDNHENCDWNS